MMSSVTRASRPSRNRLLISCATVAMATAALLPQKAHAQAFQGRINSSIGSVARSNTTATSETITIGSPTATINWTPTGQPNGSGNIDFLPSGNVATFQGTVSAGNYTVLNRIIPGGSTPIELNGTINALLSDSSTGGNIWFYSPNGILIGANAVFNVGGLLLTTADPGSNWTTSPDGFAATAPWVAAPGSFVTVSKGAQINAANSYVAMVAPRVTQAGTVNVNGSAAYVAADQVTMTVNQGLFDIAVDVGTDDPNGIVHSGTTTGAANATAADNHSIYMVAVPKNSALTMLLEGGRVGFGDAVSADVRNGQIILSSGYSVGHDDAGNALFDGLQLGSSVGGPAAGITIDGGKFSSSVNGAATGDILAQGSDGSGTGGTLEFDGNLTLQGLLSSRLVANAGDTVTVGGSANITADDFKSFVGDSSATNVDARGGTAEIRAATGGSIAINGSAAVSANAAATVNTATAYGGVAYGGTALIDSQGGTITIGGSTNVFALAAADMADNGFDGRDSQGGQAKVTAASGGSVSIGGALQVNADGDGSFSALESGGTGGRGIGGYAALSADGGASINISGQTIVSATGYGGGVINSTGGTTGLGQGGEVDLLATNGGTIGLGSTAYFNAAGFGQPFGTPPQQTALQGGEGDGGETYMNIDGGRITAAGDLNLFADGLGGTGMTGGDGYGGSAYADMYEVAGGALNVAGQLTVRAGGQGGNAVANATGAGGAGGSGTGGYAELFVSDYTQDAPSTVSLGSADISADGFGGVGGDGVTGGTGGAGQGGEADLDLETGTVTSGNLSITAGATGGAGGTGSAGDGGTGGDAYGGSGYGYIGTKIAADIQSNMQALGGNGGAGTVQGDGGYAEGGSSFFYVASGGELDGSLDLTAKAIGGTGANGGEGDGGEADLEVDGLINALSINLDASGTGGAGNSGDGGFSEGGYADLYIYGGSVDVTNGLRIDANANDIFDEALNVIGGKGAVNGGDSLGGEAGIDIYGGSLKVGGETDIVARAVGGSGGANDGATGGNGGYGEGGGAYFSVDGSDICTTICGAAVSPAAASGISVTLNDLLMNANGRGGTGGNAAAGGAGGEGDGGYVAVETYDSNFSARDIETNANGIGGIGGSGSSGVGGDGGAAFGGDGYLDVAGTVQAASLFMSAHGSGGASGTGTAGYGNGGDGYGGYIDSYFDTGAIVGIGGGSGGDPTFAGTLRLSAAGGGGDGNNGGTGYAGDVYFDLDGSLTAAALLQVTGQAFGGQGLGGAGGDAYADNGEATLNLYGSVDASQVIVGGIATAGNGATAGGNASGGYAELYLAGSATSDDVAVQTNATAGNGGSGNGGMANGGESSLSIDGGSLSVLSSSGGTHVTADASGGAGASGGSAEGGVATVETSANGGSLDTSQLDLHSSGSGGNGVAAGGSGTGGAAELVVAGSLNSGASAGVQLGSASIASNGSGGAASDAAAIGGSGAGGEVTIDFGAASPAAVDASFDVSADGNGGVGAAGLGNVLGGSVSVAAPSVSFADATFTALGGGGTIGVGDINSTGHVDLQSGGNISFGNIKAAHLDFESDTGAVTGGNVKVTDRVNGSAGGAVVLGNVAAGPGLPTGDGKDFSVAITSGTSIRIGDVTAAGSIGFATTGGLTTGNLNSGDIFLAMIGGDLATGSIAMPATSRVYVGNASMFTAAGGPNNFDPNTVLALPPVATGGSISIGGPVSTGTMQASAAGAISVAGVTAGSSVDLKSGGVATFNGTVSAPHITVTSHDIDIVAGASLGVHGVTTLITLNAVSDQPVLVGALTGSEGQYVLDEQGDIATDALVLNAVSPSGGTAPDIQIGAVTIDGSQSTGGGISSVAVNTSGSILVEGAVNYGNAGATDSLALNAGGNVEVNTTTGSIAMTNGSALAGSLTLSGANIWVADQSILTALEQDPATVTADALAANSGTSKPDGYVSAGGVVANVGSSFLVQNSGTLDDLGGITVGDGGLTINAGQAAAGFARAAEAATPSFDIYGRQSKSDGTAVTGDAFAASVTTSGAFAADSLINGCPVGGCAPPPPPPAPPAATASDQVLGPLASADTAIGDDQQSQEDKKKDNGDDEDEGINASLRLINTGPINLDQQIDEPVTSGNDVDFDLGPPPGAN
jgi:filamentous hemagglutinin family protein